MATDEVKKLLRDIELLGVPRINVSGGEALLREDIFEIITFASKRFVTVLESNGLLLTETNIKRLKDSRLSCIAVSIDNPIESEHDYLRGIRGLFKKAVEGISICVKRRLPCILSTYITKQNANEQHIRGLMDLAAKLKVMAVRVMPPRPVGSFSCQTESLLDAQKEKDILQHIDPSIAYFKGLPAPKTCGIFFRNTFYISPYGEVQPCPYVPLSFGNIREGKLSDILNRMWNHKIFRRTDKGCLILNNEFREANFRNIVNNKSILPLEVK